VEDKPLSFLDAAKEEVTQQPINSSISVYF